jgi:hypothetical protein
MNQSKLFFLSLLFAASFAAKESAQSAQASTLQPPKKTIRKQVRIHRATPATVPSSFDQSPSESPSNEAKQEEARVDSAIADTAPAPQPPPTLPKPVPPTHPTPPNPNPPPSSQSKPMANSTLLQGSNSTPKNAPTSHANALSEPNSDGSSNQAPSTSSVPPANSSNELPPSEQTAIPESSPSSPAPVPSNETTPSTPQRMDQGKLLNVPVNPPVTEGTHLSFRGDAIVWQAVEDNLTYVYAGNNTEGQRNRDLKKPSFQWDWGFRLGLGCNLPRDGWDLGAIWTHTHNTAHGEQKPSSSTILFQIWTVPAHIYPGATEKVTADWHLHLNQLDLDLGRAFYVGKHLTLRPSIGLRSSWIHQTYKVDWEGTEDSSSLEQKAKMTNRFWGFGFKAGLDTDWLLGKGFSVYGETDFALLMGFFDIDQKGTQNGTPIWEEGKSFRTGKPILDLGAGLKWAHKFYHDHIALALKAGYEYHLYFDQNQFLLSPGSDNFELYTPATGDLAFQGVVLSAELAF